ncbi:LOW QUALITY PROTEIN: MAM domain-containing glycosylphosphatidylinositol anchor protein 1-like [Leucoraja erinacea]|uniref:LOW QUALITY PROTEIN: MAM domain-containing glycosylphosphatidylinositol anchor protein 1-like n=1 Tax=Leucoraja erinaceus TaxID=7782 RepID=UPI002457325E|nr:LOW QUALITY PROTEIN: MAM domain-containing glycosylphosphatidylinositol anchor protein 1-like [Leucoraja erinacea]
MQGQFEIKEEVILELLESIKVDKSLILDGTYPRLLRAPANARIVHSGQACVVKDDNLSERVYTIREGSTLLLVCLVTGHPRPQVRWTKTVGSASERLQEGSVLNDTLRIAAIQRGQGGRYYCKAENGVGGPAIKSIRVDVQYLDEPVLTVHQSVSDVRGENYYRERTVFLRCTVQSNPPAHFTWKRDGQPVTQRQDQGVDIYEPLYTQGETKVLKLKDLRPRDYANFTCLVSVRNVCNIPDKSASFLLKNTTAPPLVSVSVPETVVVDPGTDVEMECRVEGGDPPPQLRWSHSPGPMPPNARVRGGRLWIQAVATEQAGFYNCSAHNGVGTPARRAVELLVRTLRNAGFWITPDPFHDDEQVRLDREVKVSCQVEAVPADQLTIRWLKNGRALRPSSRIIISRHDQDFPAGVSSVDIINMRFSDSATYSCLASLSSPALPDLRLDVNVSTSLMPPVLEVEQPVVEVEEGSDAELRCVVRGKPLPAVLWSRVDKERGSSAPGTPEWVTGDGTLRMEGVRRDQGGTYRCRTGRDNALNVKPREASVQLNVMYPPTVEPELLDVRQRLGVSVSLACRMVSGSPSEATQADWSLGGLPLEGPSPSPSPDPPDRSELTLPPLTARMYGLYQCRLSNGVGAQSCTFNLTGRSYEPEFYFENPQPQVRVQRPGRFSFLLQWTQVAAPRRHGEVGESWLEGRRGRARVRMGAEVIQVNRSMEPGALLSYTLSDLRIPNSYSVQLTPITSYGPGDSAQRILHYTHPASSLPPSGELVCGFEDQGLCGFTQDTRDDFDWTRENNVTQNPKNTPNTGPRFDNSGKKTGYYMFIEASTPRRLGDRARLSSPLYNVSQKRGFRPPRTTPFCVSFYYHMYGKHVGSLNVLLRSPGVKTVEKTVWTLSGNQAEEWRRGSVTINPSSPFQVVLEAVRGAGYLGDIGRDDVSITRGPCNKRPFSEKDVIPRDRNAAAAAALERPWAAGLQPLLLVALGGRALPR